MDKEKLNKMKTYSFLLPDPGGEVVRECIDKIEALEAENANLRQQIAGLVRFKDQNERMRDWFKERTGLDSFFVGDHMNAIDRQNAELVKALEGLYNHTKNDHVIHGLNVKAKAALDSQP